jgi:hypothetical protein
LSWDDAGRVAVNPFALQGTFYTYQDCGDVAAAVSAATFVCPNNPTTADCCTAWSPSLVGPAPASKAGYSVSAAVQSQSSARVCLKGVATQVLTGVDGLPSYIPQWGAGLGLPLNDSLPFDASRAFAGGPIVGFSFDLEGPTSATAIRVGVHAQNAGNDLYFADLPVPTSGVTVMLSALHQGSWVAVPVPLDPSALTQLDFQVFTTTGAPTPFDFCVTNLSVLQ